MALSTGFDETKVLAAFTGRLGWKQPTQEPYNIISEANQESASGRFFNDGSFHASCTAEVLFETQEDAYISEEAYNSFIETLKGSVALSCLNNVFDKLEVIESGLVFKPCNMPSGTTTELVANVGKFVGIRVNVAQGDWAVVIDRITVLLDSAKTFNVYIYKDLKTAALATIPVTTTAWEETTVNVGRTLNYLSDSNKGGSYYIGYYQNDLGDARAVDIQPHIGSYKIFGTTSIKANTDVTFGFNRFSYESSYDSYGLNLEMSSYKDYTQIIVNAANSGVFDNYFGLSMAAKVIEQAVNTTRSNSSERTSAANVQKMYDELNLEPDNTEMPVSPGLKSRLRKELKVLKEVFHQKDKAISVSTC